MTSDESADLIECVIGVREILSADGAVKRRLTVHCEPRREAVYVANCANCGRCLGVRPTAPGRPGVVLCQRLDGDEAPPVTRADVRIPVRTVMGRNVVCVTADVSVETVAGLLVELGAGGVPVVDEDGHAIGMISATDLLRKRPGADGRAAQGRDADLAGVADPTSRSPSACRTAGEMMTPCVFSVVESTELVRATALMASEGLDQLPVLMGDGSVGGMLSTRDVARWVAQS